MGLLHACGTGGGVTCRLLWSQARSLLSATAATTAATTATTTTTTIYTTQTVTVTATVASPSASASKKPKTFANLLFLMSDHFSYRRAGDDKTQRLPRSQRPKTTTKAYRRRQAQIQNNRQTVRVRDRAQSQTTTWPPAKKTNG